MLLYIFQCPHKHEIIYIYICIMVQGCTHGKFKVIFHIGGVELVGNTGTSAE